MTPGSHAAVLDADFRTACARTRTDDPWHGAFALEVEGRTRDYRVGKAAHPDLRIIPWQHPYARAFYEGRAGAVFEYEPERSGTFAPAEGTIGHIARVVAAHRALERVVLEDGSGRHVLLRQGDVFVSEEDSVAPAGGEGRRHGLPDVLSLLTPDQYRLITASRHAPVILQGRAGSGKTTVALHRVAWLTHADSVTGEPPVDPSRVLIVMFNKALTTFVERSLAPLGLESVQIDTFHAWALSAIRRAYLGEVVPKRIVHPGRDTALALKRQVGVLRLLEELVSGQERSLGVWLEEKLAPYDARAWRLRFARSEGPIVSRLVTVRRAALAARDAAKTVREQRTLEQVYQVFRAAKDRMTKYKEELFRCLTDADLLSRHLTATSAEIEALVSYQRSLQGEGGTDRRPGPHVGFEDFALLLRIIQLKHGGLPDKERDDRAELFEHLVVDEAQDFGAVELTVLLAAVRARTGVTIVGDLNQKILPDADFIGWEALAAELGVHGASVARLEVGHRSTKPIVELAASIAGVEEATGRPGPLPTLTRTTDRASLVAEVARLAAATLGDKPGAHVCVVCTTTREAKEHHAALLAAVPDLVVRLGHNAGFAFEPGITVTNLRQVKGLEFDVVIVVDLSAAAYPVTEQGRRWLYTVLTRAKDALHLVTQSEPTPLLDQARARGLVVEEDQAEVPAVQFAPEDDDPF